MFGERMFVGTSVRGRTSVRRTSVLWTTLWTMPVDNVPLIPRVWTNLWTVDLWTTLVDKGEVIPSLWITLWITWGPNKCSGKAEPSTKAMRGFFPTRQVYGGRPRTKFFGARFLNRFIQTGDGLSCVVWNGS